MFKIINEVAVCCKGCGSVHWIYKDRKEFVCKSGCRTKNVKVGRAWVTETDIATELLQHM